MYNLLDSVCTIVGMAAMCWTRTRKVRRGSRGEEIISDDGLSVNSTRKEDHSQSHAAALLMKTAETNQVPAQSTRQVGGCRQDNDKGSKAVWGPVCKVGLV